jgi:signal transduction histidine kinase
MRGWGWQSVHDPAVLPLVMERWTHSVASGTAFEMVFPLKGADGRFRTFLTRVAPLRDGRGHVQRWFGTNTDVTEQHAAEAALREADQRKDDFLAMLAHELRNPLAPIRNAVRLLKADVPSAAQAQARAIIERQSALMARLLDDLLDLSRITRGIIELRREVLDVRRIVEQVVLANRALVERLHHETIVNLSGDPLLVEADPTRLHQILDNLLQNAAKYTDPGGRIEVSASAEADVIVLCVADTGIGLSPEITGAGVRSLLTDPFVRTGTQRSRDWPDGGQATRDLARWHRSCRERRSRPREPFSSDLTQNNPCAPSRAARAA